MDHAIYKEPDVKCLKGLCPPEFFRKYSSWSFEMPTGDGLMRVLLQPGVSKVDF